MSNSRIDSSVPSVAPVPTRSSVEVAPARTRQTEAAATPFRTVLAGGASALLTGAEMATSVMAGPVLAAAVHRARVDVADRIVGDPGTGAGAAMAGPASGDTYLDKVHLMQKESQLFNAQLLQLQEEVQAENRRFTTLSNVCRAKHDTASACVKNIH
jgi:hypothetical protein